MGARPDRAAFERDVARFAQAHGARKTATEPEGFGPKLPAQSLRVDARDRRDWRHEMHRAVASSIILEIKPCSGSTAQTLVRPGQAHDAKSLHHAVDLVHRQRMIARKHGKIDVGSLDQGGKRVLRIGERECVELR